MTKAERIEKIAEWLYIRANHLPYPWATIGESTRNIWRGYAKTMLAFLGSMGAVWLAEDQDWPETDPDASQEWNRGFTTAMMCCARNNFLKVEAP